MALGDLSSSETPAGCPHSLFWITTPPPKIFIAPTQYRQLRRLRGLCGRESSWRYSKTNSSSPLTSHFRYTLTLPFSPPNSSIHWPTVTFRVGHEMFAKSCGESKFCTALDKENLRVNFLVRWCPLKEWVLFFFFFFFDFFFYGSRSTQLDTDTMIGGGKTRRQLLAQYHLSCRNFHAFRLFFNLRKSSRFPTGVPNSLPHVNAELIKIKNNWQYCKLIDL